MRILNSFVTSLTKVLHYFLCKQVGTDSLAASDMEKSMRYVMRAMPILIFPFIAKFPAVCISCTSLFFHFNNLTSFGIDLSVALSHFID